MEVIAPVMTELMEKGGQREGQELGETLGGAGVKCVVERQWKNQR